MISYETLLAEMEKHMELAKRRANEHQFREHVIALRALCDVALSTNHTDNPVTIHKREEKIEERPMIYSNLPSEPMKEEDANGSSIFDF